jgi:hypothetical protein
VEHPGIRYVVYPVHRDGSLTGAQPRLRHDPGCSHFDWGDGILLGTPVLATAGQMRSLEACKTCIETRGESPGSARSGAESRTGILCPDCSQVMPLTGVCDNCGGRAAR